MKMHAIRGENMMRMKYFDISFDDKGALITVSGRNGEGKSSLLNSIVLCLGGSKTDVAKLTTKPIREGAEKGWVEVDIGDWTVRRSWTSNDKDSLSIIGKSGEKFASPQKMLDKIIGDLGFDPLAFSRMKPKEQKELLLSIVDIPLDLDSHEAKRKEIFEKRTDIGRERDRLAGAIESLPDLPGGIPDEEVSVAAVVKQKEEADAQNRAYEKAERDFDAARQWVANAEEDLKNAKEKLEEAKKAKAAIGGAVPVSHFQDQIDNAEAINANVRAKKNEIALRKQWKEQEAKYESGTQFLAKMDQEKQDALRKAEMPIEGLSLDEDGVTYKGIPFGQLSQAEQIKVSAAIGMSQNAELPLMIVRDGSLLDSKNLKALADLAEANEFQILVEMVDENAETGIIIEDGEVVSADSK